MAAEHRNVDTFLRRLWALEGQLLKARFEPMPAWWRDTLERFYRAGKRRLVVRKGRRVYASTCVAPRLAVAEMLWGNHPHVHGSPPLVFAFLSVRRDEAAKRLRGVMAILDALDVKYAERGETVELLDRPAAFTVVTANHKTSVGDTVAFAWCDEVASWSDDAVGANPAEEVIGRLAPALATLPDAKLFLVSSPLSVDDFHARQFDIGETPAQCVAFGATWTINPNMTEEQTHAEEPDPRRWLREWAAVPSPAISAAFDMGDSLKSFADVPKGYRAAGWICLCDPSGGGDDPFAFGLCSWLVGPSVPEFLTETVYIGGGTEYERYLLDEAGAPLKNPRYETNRRPPILRLALFGQVANARAQGITLQRIVGDLARSHCHPNGVGLVVGDQFEAFGLESEFPKYGLRYLSLPWTNSTKLEAVARISSWMRDGVLSIQADSPFAPELKKQLLSFDERISKSGAIKYSGRGSVHDDLVSVLLLAARADEEGLLPMSPYKPPAQDRTEMFAELERRFGDGDGPTWQPARRISAEHRAMDAADRVRPGGATPLSASTRATLSKLAEDT